MNRNESATGHYAAEWVIDMIDQVEAENHWNGIHGRPPNRLGPVLSYSMSEMSLHNLPPLPGELVLINTDVICGRWFL